MAKAYSGLVAWHVLVLGHKGVLIVAVANQHPVLILIRIPCWSGTAYSSGRGPLLSQLTITNGRSAIRHLRTRRLAGTSATGSWCQNPFVHVSIDDQWLITQEKVHDVIKSYTIIRRVMQQSFSSTLPGTIKFSRRCRQRQAKCNFNSKLRNSYVNSNWRAGAFK